MGKEELSSREFWSGRCAPPLRALVDFLGRDSLSLEEYSIGVASRLMLLRRSLGGVAHTEEQEGASETLRSMIRELLFVDSWGELELRLNALPPVLRSLFQLEEP